MNPIFHMANYLYWSLYLEISRLSSDHTRVTIRGLRGETGSWKLILDSHAPLNFTEKGYKIYVLPSFFTNPFHPFLSRSRCFSAASLVRFFHFRFSRPALALAEDGTTGSQSRAQLAAGCICTCGWAWVSFFFLPGWPPSVALHTFALRQHARPHFQTKKAWRNITSCTPTTPFRRGTPFHHLPLILMLLDLCISPLRGTPVLVNQGIVTF